VARGGILAFGQYDSAGAAGGTQNGSDNCTCTEEYNGTSWSSGGAITTARREGGGAGTQDEGIIFGGRSTVEVGSTEEYNGTSWSVQNGLNNPRQQLAGSGNGTQNAASAFGGGGTASSCTEAYNGTSWSNCNNMSTNRSALGGAGKQFMAVAFGGVNIANCACTEEFTGGYL
jgi:hypothetical protein